MGSSYLLLKSLHILGVVLFLGNIVITGWWKVMADRTCNPQVIAFAQRQVTLTDFVFTAGGATLVLAAGLGNAVLHGLDVMHSAWLYWGLGLFTASGIIWGVILIPAQIRMATLAHAFDQPDGKITAEYWTLNRRWYVWGIIATVLPLMNLYWMVYKPS